MAVQVKIRAALGLLTVILVILPMSLVYFQQDNPTPVANLPHPIPANPVNPANGNVLALVKRSDRLGVPAFAADQFNIAKPAAAKGAANLSNLVKPLPKPAIGIGNPAKLKDVKLAEPDRHKAAEPAKLKAAEFDKPKAAERVNLKAAEPAKFKAAEPVKFNAANQENLKENDRNAAADPVKRAANKEEPAAAAAAPPVQRNRNVDIFSKKIEFDNFDNVTGAYYFIVPNTVHFIRFNTPDFTFPEFICVLAAFKNQQPDRIMFHTNVDDFEGRYWEMMQSIDELSEIISINKIELPNTIFGQKLSEEWQEWHGSDLARIKTVMAYGGIYLDNDVYIVQSLDRYRVFELALGWDEGQLLGTQVIIGHRDARFLPMWLNTYRQYRPDLWYYNAGEKPTKEILEKKPELVHRVKLKFGIQNLLAEMFTRYWKEWRDQETIHLLVGHRYYLDPHYKEFKDFDEDMIRDYEYTFGEMAREILDHFGF